MTRAQIRPNTGGQPQVEVHKSRYVGTHAGELFPEEPEVVPAEMAKEASTEGPTDKEDFPNDRNYKRSLGTMVTTVCVENRNRGSSDHRI